MNRSVDSFRFLDTITRALVQRWIAMEPAREPVWTPLAKPLSECTVAVLSSAGIALQSDKPFDQDGERANPWWGDPGYRVVPRTARAPDIRSWHLHINPSFAQQDLNCVLPAERLDELATAGETGRCADSHYSCMGYLLNPEVFLDESVPAVVGLTKKEQVDIALLAPA